MYAFRAIYSLSALRFGHTETYFPLGFFLLILRCVCFTIHVKQRNADWGQFLTPAYCRFGNFSKFCIYLFCITYTFSYTNLRENAKDLPDHNTCWLSGSSAVAPCPELVFPEQTYCQSPASAWTVWPVCGQALSSVCSATLYKAFPISRFWGSDKRNEIHTSTFIVCLEVDLQRHMFTLL